MDQLSTSQRQYLRRLAHPLRPVAHIGKNGLTEQVVAAVDQGLGDHELIKVKFQDHQDAKRALASTLVEETRSTLVGIIGNVVILYRRNTDPTRRKVILPAP